MHEAQVEDIDAILSRNARTIKTGLKSSLIAPALYTFMGGLFLLIGLFRSYNIEWFSVIMGGGFIVFGAITFLNSRAIWRKKV